MSIPALAGLQRFFDDFPEKAQKAAVMALNQTLERKAVPQFQKDVLAEAAFPAGYLDSRLGLVQKATAGSLEARIVARDRPTSLARFATSGVVGGGGNVAVTVNPGSTKPIKGAFLVRLKSGTAMDSDNFNIGLALRLKKGQTVLNKKDTSKMVHLEPNVVLLYGPSVGQVADDVFEADTPEVIEDIADEFFRQLVRIV